MKKSILETIHEAAQESNAIGGISDRALAEIAALASPLSPSFSPAEICEIRESWGLSVAELGEFLEISSVEYESLEAGESEPSDFVARMLGFVEEHGIQTLTN